jgi:DNA-binding XRE family transcriptional regulator
MEQTVKQVNRGLKQPENTDTAGQRLRRVRLYMGMSLRQFSELIGISHPTLCRWEVHDRVVGWRLAAIQKTCPEIDRNWILTGEGEMLLPTLSGKGTVALKVLQTLLGGIRDGSISPETVQAALKVMSDAIDTNDSPASASNF